ncbi:hypothetical protein [Microbacterium sp. SA39]|uniref:hypothetical protein n=1 Tax=Microbacterium sp. SA39 TaxID=1263625 RepID=UPI0005F9B48C|nr:hypothetical protein [Microbacterium sp. SA39]KJQ55615.1 hypothetical protein RS85_00478 [Microbacterium sp. SA39]
MRHRLIPVYAVVAGVLMATFQLLRPWGDVTEEPDAVAEAFADPRWVIAHLAGAAAFVVLALLADAVVTAGLREQSVRRRSPVARIARYGTAVGAVLILPYYGAETFALHEIGRAALAGSPVDVLALSGSIRGNVVAATLFGVGLLLVAAGMVCLAVVAGRAGAAVWGAWPLGVLAALALPQFVLPPIGRMAYGVAFLLAAVVFATAWSRRRVPQ